MLSTYNLKIVYFINTLRPDKFKDVAVAPDTTDQMNTSMKIPWEATSNKSRWPVILGPAQKLDLGGLSVRHRFLLRTRTFKWKVINILLGSHKMSRC